jgi:peptide/nickel transport system substrate-binding protein
MSASRSVLVALALGAVACGGGAREPKAVHDGTPPEHKLGGKVIALWAEDPDSIDPALTWSTGGIQIVRATQKTLYSPRVDDATEVEPDLAAAAPQISADGCRVTVTLKPGVQFSPPVSRSVTSADVQYAIERGFFDSVITPYAENYFGSLRGAKMGAEPGTEIPGITTPNDQTVVFDLEPQPGSSRCAGSTLASALAMPISAPVPREFAKRFDAESPSTYGVHQVATGPYRLEEYRPGRQIRLVRNPNWNRQRDTRPAYLDEIEIRQGNDDATVTSRRILEGENMISGDQQPPPAILRSALADRKSQIQPAPLGGTRWVAMNTTIPPLDNVDVRRAVIAGFDREAMRLTLGGEASGDIATHFLAPGVKGFDEAGGREGPDLDFMAKPRGDLQLAAEYFRRAGFESGAYEGDEELLMVGENVASDAALVAQQQFKKLGFDVRLRLLSTRTVYAKFCGVPGAAVAICPNVAWAGDFGDPEPFLRPAFSGDGGANWSRLDDPGLNRRMADAALVVDPAERAQAWGEIDTEITRLAVAIPWHWPRWMNLRSENVVGTIDAATAMWSLAHLSLR